ncbi:hypothetical protein ACLQ24_13040 [Micromonospora sp. DT4]
MPPEVIAARSMPGVHLVHTDVRSNDVALVVATVMAQPSSVIERAVEVPVASLVESLDLDGAIARANALRLPVRLPNRALVEAGGEDVLPIDERGFAAAPGHAGWVLVVPDSPLLAGHAAPGLDAERIVGSGVTSGPLPSALDQAGLWVPLPIVNARYGGLTVSVDPIGLSQRLEDGVRGLWRVSADLTPTQGLLVTVDTSNGADATDLLALRSPEGVALLSVTPGGARGATLPRNATALHVRPASVSVEARFEHRSSPVEMVRPSTPRWPVVRPVGAFGVSDELAAAVMRLPEWADKPDCVARVDTVLYHYGLRAGGDDTVRPIDNIASRLGGPFQTATIDRLQDLEPGAITVIRADYPGQQPHLMIVERQADDSFMLVETQPSRESGDEDTSPVAFVSFELKSREFHVHHRTPYGLPQALHAPIALPRRSDGLLGQANRDGLLRTGSTSKASANAPALLDPSIGSTGMRSQRGADAANSNAKPTDDVIRPAFDQVQSAAGETWESLDPVTKSHVRNFLQIQARRDGGWSKAWPIGAYIRYYINCKEPGNPIMPVDREVTRALIDTPGLAEAARHTPHFIRMLQRDITVIDKLRHFHWRRTVQALTRKLDENPELLDPIMADPVLEPYLRNTIHQDVWQLIRLPTLYGELGNNGQLFHLLAATPWGIVAGKNPTLSEFLRTDAESLEVVRQASLHVGLATALIDHPVRSKPARWWGKLLRNTALLRDLDRNQGAIRAVAAARLIDAVDFLPRSERLLRLELLAGAPELADVLVEASGLMRKFFQSDGLQALQAATNNRQAVTLHLSVDPAAFDTVPDLVVALRQASLPSTAEPPAASSFPEIARAVRRNPNLGKVLAAKQTKAGSGDALALLLRNAGLLHELINKDLAFMPHEYRRLLNAVSENKIMPPFPDAGILRVMLSYPSAVEELANPVSPASVQLSEVRGNSQRVFDKIMESMRSGPSLVGRSVLACSATFLVRSPFPSWPEMAAKDGNYVGISRNSHIFDLVERWRPESREKYYDCPDLVALTLYQTNALVAIDQLIELAPPKHDSPIEENEWWSDFFAARVYGGHSFRSSLRPPDIAPNVIENIVRFPRLLAALVALPVLNDGGARHWRRLFSLPSLMESLERLLAAPGADAALVEGVLASDVIVPFLGLADPQAALTDPRFLTQVLSGEAERRHRVLDLGLDELGLNMTSDGVPASDHEFALAGIIARGSAGLEQFEAAAVSSERSSEFSGLVNAFRSDADLQEAVRGNFPLAVLMVKNPRTAVVLRDRPLLQPLASKDSITRSLLDNPAVVEALDKSDQFHALFVSQAEFREAIAAKNGLLNAFLNNPALTRVCQDDRVLFNVLSGSFLGEIVLIDSDFASAVAADRKLREALIDEHENLQVVSLVRKLTALTPEVRLAVAMNRTFFRLWQEDEVAFYMLAHRPALVAGLTSSTCAPVEFEELRRLPWTNQDFLDLIERRIASLNDALFTHDGVFAWVSKRPATLYPILEANPWLPELLTRPMFRLLVEENPHVVDALVSFPSLRAFVVLPGVAEMLSARSFPWRLLDRPDLVDALTRNPSLVAEFGRRGEDPAPLWQALTNDRALAAGVSPAGLRSLKRHPKLVAALASAGSTLTQDEWAILLKDESELDRLSATAGGVRRGDQLAAMFRVPRIAAPPTQQVIPSTPLIARPPEKSSTRAVAGRAVVDSSRVSAVAGRAVVDSSRVSEGAGRWLNDVPTLLSRLRESSGADLAEMFRRSPDLLHVLRHRDDLAALVAADPASAAQYSFRWYLDGDGRAVKDFKGAVSSWAAALGITLDADLQGHARAVWGFVHDERAAADAEKRRAVAKRRADLRPADYLTWDFSGEVKLGGLVTEGDFDRRDRKDLIKVVMGGVGTREGLRGSVLNSARHAHLAGGKQGVAYTFVVNPEWTVDLLVYTRSDGRRGNNYVWLGHSVKQDSAAPASLSIAAADPTLKLSKELVAGLQLEATAIEVPGPVPTPMMSNPLGEALHAYHLAYVGAEAAILTTAPNVKRGKGKAALTVTDSTRRLNDELRAARARLGDFGVADQLLGLEAVGDLARSGPPLVPALADEMLGQGDRWSGDANLLAEPVVLLPEGTTEDAEQRGLYWVGDRPPARLQRQIRAAAGQITEPVIFLGAKTRGGAALAEHVRDVRRLVQQFAIKKQQPVIVTQAATSTALQATSGTYGFAIVSHVANSAVPAGGLATSMSLSPTWQVRASDGRTMTLGETFAVSFLVTAQQLGRRAEDSTLPAVGRLLLAPTRVAKLQALQSIDGLDNQRARDDLQRIVDQVENDLWFRKFTPLLGELGQSGKAEIVLDYQEQVGPVERNKLLISDLISVSVEARVNLVQDSGYQTVGVAAVLGAVDLIFTTAGLPAAKDYVKRHAADLNVAGKQDWVDAIAAISQERSDKREELRQLAVEVYNCAPPPEPAAAGNRR